MTTYRLAPPGAPAAPIPDKAANRKKSLYILMYLKYS